MEELFDALSALNQVEAIALGGSRAGDDFDEKSDYDVYVYCREAVPEDVRSILLQKYCSRMEIGNHFWEYEDNCILKNGIDIDIIYRNLDAFAKEISDVVDKYYAHNGYTTCMWHNLCTCRIIYDEDGRLSSLQKKYTIPYPDMLRQNIIKRNMDLLRYAMPAYEVQIAKAVKRNDMVSINHRITEFLASYFDVIFALNELTHPGEKRLIVLCEKQCKKLPVNFRENLQRLFSDMFDKPERISEDIDVIISALEKLLEYKQEIQDEK